MTKKSCFPAIIILFFLWIMSVPLLNFGQERNIRPRYGGVFRLKSFTTSFRMQLDPAHPDSSIFISEQIFDGLVRLDKDLNPVPSLAEYWKVSSDNTQYTFYLRKGVRFHNGDELTAEDVKFSLERLIDRETGSPYYQFFLPRVVGAQEFREGTVCLGFVSDEHAFL